MLKFAPMWAIVEIGKKQYFIEEGQSLEVERLKEDKGEIFLDKVLLLACDEKVKIGTPYLDNVKVKAEIKEELKGKKIIVYKCKRRKKYRKKQGHRQIYTLLKILQIVTS